MAGHSKWANIQHRKKAQDAKRGKLFTKLIREVVVAAKDGPDPSQNPKLRLAVDRALQGNMTRDTIDRAIARGSGNNDGADVVSVRYEGYGPGGVAVLVDCLTDNRNRTVAEVRHAFSKAGGNLGTEGSVAYLFEHQGLIVVDGSVDEEALLDVALEGGATDVTRGEGGWEVTTGPSDYLNLTEAFQAKGWECLHQELGWVSSHEVTLSSEDFDKVERMCDVLENLDDVQDVYHNAALEDN